MEKVEKVEAKMNHCIVIYNEEKNGKKNLSVEFNCFWLIPIGIIVIYYTLRLFFSFFDITAGPYNFICPKYSMHLSYASVNRIFSGQLTGPYAMYCHDFLNEIKLLRSYAKNIELVPFSSFICMILRWYCT